MNSQKERTKTELFGQHLQRIAGKGSAIRINECFLAYFPYIEKKKQ
jgi:hypothetical protein